MHNRCVILGNSPTAKEVRTDDIQNAFKITVNAGLLIFKDLDMKCDLLHLQDPRFFEQKEKFLTEYTDFVSAISVADHIHVPHRLAALCREKSIAVTRPKIIGNIGFSRNLDIGFFTGYSAAYGALQVAAHHGFSKISIAGVDFSYGSSNNRIYESSNGLDRDLHVLNRQIHTFRYGLKQCLAEGVAVDFIAGGDLFKDLARRTPHSL